MLPCVYSSHSHQSAKQIPSYASSQKQIRYCHSKQVCYSFLQGFYCNDKNCRPWQFCPHHPGRETLLIIRKDTISSPLLVQVIFLYRCYSENYLLAR